jgi:hypothetical protein
MRWYGILLLIVLAIFLVIVYENITKDSVTGYDILWHWIPLLAIIILITLFGIYYSKADDTCSPKVDGELLQDDTCSPGVNSCNGCKNSIEKCKCYKKKGWTLVNELVAIDNAGLC